ncbi:MAG: DUF4123 domain-containing protein [Thermoanaerobaculia bacterium]
MPIIRAQALLDLLCPSDPGSHASRAYAILDAARNDEIHPALLDADCPTLSLYRGDAAERMAEVAPYLVALERGSRFTRWLLERGWGDSWAVFVVCPAAAEPLRNHFRRLLMVQLPGGRAVYFRFYDPRVLRVYLPTCTPDELKTIFGPVECYVAEGEDPDEALAFRLDRDGLVQSRRRLETDGQFAGLS